MTKQTTQELQAIVDGGEGFTHHYTLCNGTKLHAMFGVNYISLDSIREILELRNKIESFEAIETDNHEYMDIQVTEIGKLESTVLELRKEVERYKKLNADYVWFTRDEVKGLDENQTGIINLAKLKLEMQAKGIEDYVKLAAEKLQKAPWFKESTPTLEQLYDLDFGLGGSDYAIDQATKLRQQAKGLK